MKRMSVRRLRARPAGEREGDVRLPQASDVDLLLAEQNARVREVIRRDRPATSSMVFTSLEATQASPPRDQSI